MFVRDNGTGVEVGTRQHLYETSPSSSPGEPAQAQGSATAYGIVRQSGGPIMVDSEWGKAATFSIYLPGIEPSARQGVLQPGGRLLAEVPRNVRRPLQGSQPDGQLEGP